MHTQELARERALDQIENLAEVNAMLDRIVPNLKFKLLTLARDGYAADKVMLGRQTRRELDRLVSFVQTLEAARMHCADATPHLEAAE